MTNNLHEQYQTLLRRGMPEHPRLRYSEAVESWYASNSYFSEHRDDARDLITQHALRWLLAISVSKGIDDPPLSQFFAGECGEVTGEVMCLVMKDDPNPLAPILAATAHLEPA